MLATQEVFRENENLKSRVMHLEKELSLTRYEKDKLERTFEDLRKKIEERVPAIAEVERRRLELESEAVERQIEVKNLQEQLKD